MTVGGLSVFLVCFVGFVALSGKDVSRVAVIGKLFPAPDAPPEGEHGAAPTDEHAPPERQRNLSDAAVIEASLGVLSAWTLPSPYSTSELRQLSEEIEHRQEQLEARELELARRERTVQEDEREVEERKQSLDDLRVHLEGLQQELAEGEAELSRKQDAARAGEDARWAEVGRVIAGLEDAEAGRRLQEYGPADAARILRSLGDDERASEILNQVEGARWKEYVDAYTAEKARGPGRRK